MSFGAHPHKLFVYGTLCDPDLFEIVAGVPIERFRPLPASAQNVRTMLSTNEPMPLIRRGPGRVKGLLLHGLGAVVWRRIHFYEADVYTLAPIRLQLESGASLNAAAFWPKCGTPVLFKSWKHRAWESTEKPGALAAAQRFMDYLNAPPGTDLIEVWRDIKASLQ